MAAPKDDSVRSVIRSILVSNAFEMTAATLDRDFKDMEGYCIPYSKFGYRSLVDYLRSIPDAVTIKGGNPSNPVLVPVTKEEAAHIDKMVRKQKVASHRPRRMPARRSLNNNVSVTKHACTFGKGPVSQVPRNIHNKPETQQNASDTNRPRINVEFLKRRMASIIQGNMRKVKTSSNPFKNKCAVDSTFLQNQIKNFKIKTDYSTYEVGPKTNEPNGSRGATKQADTTQMSLGSSQLPHGGGLLFNSNGKFNLPNLSHSNPLAGQPIFNTSPNVSFLSSSRTTEPRWNYAKENTSKPPPRSVAPPPMQQNQPSQQLKVVSGERRRNLCAAGAEGSRQEAEWWTTESPAAVLSGERRRNLCAAGAEGSRQEAEWWTTESTAAETNSEPLWRTESSASRVAAGADNSPERRNSSSSDFSEDDYEYDTRISHKMQKNFKILLERRPDGFLCSELPALYESEFQASFCCQDYGYNSVIQMAAEHPNIFNFSRIDRTSDWLLKRPEQKDCPQKKQDTLKPFLPKRIIENVLQLLKLYPDGLPMNFLLERYQNYFNEPFDFEKYGESLEAVINDLEKFVHKRRAGKVILLYPVSKMKETVLDDKSLAFSAALPNIQANILHKDLYPDECCNYDDNIPIQKLPEFNESSYVEVRVSDLASPHEMWFHVAKCYSSLMIMMDDLHKFYSAYESEYVMPEVTIKPRQLCACVFGEMKKWHRAIISSCIKEKRCVVVEYIDYGTKMSVDQSILRFLHKDFAVMARQAIKGRLLEVQPPAGCEGWPVTSNEYLIDLTVDRRLLLEVINIRHLSPQDYMVEGFLYDTNGEDDIIINDEMVKSGHAMLKENATDVENCPSPTVKPSISQLNSPNSSDIPVVWRGKTATSQPSQVNSQSLRNVKPSTLTNSLTRNQYISGASIGVTAVTCQPSQANSLSLRNVKPSTLTNCLTRNQYISVTSNGVTEVTNVVENNNSNIINNYGASECQTTLKIEKSSSFTVEDLFKKFSENNQTSDCSDSNVVGCPMSQAADPSLSKSGMFPVAKLEETFKPASTKHYEKEDCNGGLGSSKMLNFLETNGARSTPKTYGGNARLSESDSTSVTPKTENPISVDQTLKIVTSNCNENVVNNTRSKRKSLFDFML